MISAEILEYIASHSLAEDPFLLELKKAAVDEGIPDISVAPVQSRLIQILIALRGARDVIEVGTLAGYSAIQMARALPSEGRVRTLELDEKHAAFAKRWVAKSDVAAKVEVIQGGALESLQSMASESSDAIFIDADKANYLPYLEEGLRVLREGGLVMVDNALAFGELLNPSSEDASVLAVREFNEAIHRDPRVDAVIVPLGDGFWVGIKK